MTQNTYKSVFRSDLYKDEIHIVTGGGSGIGRCIAHELASLGAHVVLIGRKEEKLIAVRDEIIEDGGVADYWTLDIRDEENGVRVISEIVAKHGKIDALVNNAGGQYPAPAETIKKKGFDAVVSTNVTGGFLLARECFNQSMKKNGGAIVNIVADMWGGMPGMVHSGVARAGMVNLSQSLAVEWGRCGVRVNAVAPGFIASSGLDQYQGRFMHNLLPGMIEEVPLKRLSEESEVSAAVTFLLSPAAAFISGDCINVDGAASCNRKMWPLPPAKNNDPFDGYHRRARPKVLDEVLAEMEEKRKAKL